MNSDIWEMFWAFTIFAHVASFLKTFKTDWAYFLDDRISGNRTWVRRNFKIILKFLENFSKSIFELFPDHKFDLSDVHKNLRNMTKMTDAFYFGLNSGFTVLEVATFLKKIWAFF